jgi:hypothetical protein
MFNCYDCWRVSDRLDLKNKSEQFVLREHYLSNCLSLWESKDQVSYACIEDNLLDPSLGITGSLQLLLENKTRIISHIGRYSCYFEQETDTTYCHSHFQTTTSPFLHERSTRHGPFFRASGYHKHSYGTSKSSVINPYPPSTGLQDQPIHRTVTHHSHSIAR